MSDDDATTAVPNELEDKPEATVGDIDLDMLMDVPVTMTVEVGRKSLTIKELLSLTPGSVVSFDRSVTEPMDIMIMTCFMVFFHTPSRASSGKLSYARASSAPLAAASAAPLRILLIKNIQKTIPEPTGVIKRIAISKIINTAEMMTNFFLPK